MDDLVHLSIDCRKDSERTSSLLSTHHSILVLVFVSSIHHERYVCSLIELLISHLILRHSKLSNMNQNFHHELVPHSFQHNQDANKRDVLTQHYNHSKDVRIQETLCSIVLLNFCTVSCYKSFVSNS